MIINFILNYELRFANKKEENDYTVHVFRYAFDGFNVKLKKREQKL